jgi:hypothetical protein
MIPARRTYCDWIALSISMHCATHRTCTAMQKLRIVMLAKIWHLVIENGYRMMEKSKTPRRKVR